MTAAWITKERRARAPSAPAGSAASPGAPRRPLEAASSSWMADAACKGIGPGEFFDRGGRGEKWCRRCEVADCCFWWATALEAEIGGSRDRFGIWGGATPAKRRLVTGVVGTAIAPSRLGEAIEGWRRASKPTERRAG